MSLPKFQSEDNAVNLMQSNWKADLDPLLRQPFSNGLIISNVPLTAGFNTIDHRLSRDLVGWIVTRQRGQATIYDLQDLNPLPAKTLQLMSSSGVNVDLFVF